LEPDQKIHGTGFCSPVGGPKSMGYPWFLAKKTVAFLIFIFPGKDVCFQLLTAYSGQE
jgi:hypothetical protein